MNMRGASGLGLATLLAVSCGASNETSNLVAFKGSACKGKDGSSPSSNDLSHQALLVAPGEPAYEGLQCLAWRRIEPDRLKIDLINFDGACGAQWVGESNLDQKLNLRIANPECRIALCGSCIYDWSFEVRGVPAGEIPLAITVDTCPGKTDGDYQKSYQATLPAEPQGTLCRYAAWGALQWHAGIAGTCGLANMPCSLSTQPGAFCSDSAGCKDNLTCTSNGNANQTICVASCQSDGDCPADGLLSCQDNLCRPARPW